MNDPKLAMPPPSLPRGQETIFYRGKRVLVEVVKTINTRRDRGVDALLVDAHGRYYYRRQRWKDARDVEPQHTLLHRLSLLGAILWELGLDGTGGHSVLRDATNVLLRHSVNVFALDNHAQRLVRHELQDNPDQIAGDLVNAGVYFLLGNEDTDSHGCKEQARQRRLESRREAA